MHLHSELVGRLRKRTIEWIVQVFFVKRQPHLVIGFGKRAEEAHGDD